MFTGIVQAIGTVASLDARGADLRLRVDTADLDLADVRVGDSIAVSGVCLSAVEVLADGFSADVSRETLACTTLGGLAVGSRVNLEKALLPTTRIGGHLVSGHVDGVGRVEEARAAGACRVLRIAVPAPLARYIAAKGSVSVDGVSLTINETAGEVFSVNLIPHTLEHTVCGEYRPGTAVNIEVDVVARYLERLLAAGAAAPGGRGIDRDLLTEHGFIPNVQDA